MSGREEVAGLLKDLADKTIDIAAAANKAREIQTKYGADLDKNEKDLQARLAEAARPQTPAQQNAEARKTEAEAKKAEVASNAAKLDAAKEHLTPAEQKPVRAEIAKKWTDQAKSIEVLLYFKHGLGERILDGEFDIQFEGPTLEFASVVTSLGAAKASISKWPAGDYGVVITGKRTRLPNLVAAEVTVPKIGNHEGFTVALNKYIELKGLELSGNGKMKVEANSQRVVLNIAALETATSVTQEIDYSREQGVELQAEIGFGAKLKDVDLGSVKVGGTSIDVGTNSTQYIITLPFTYLTGGLEIS